MAVDFQQVSEQIKKLGEQASQRARSLQELRDRALAKLRDEQQDLVALRHKAQRIVQQYDAGLRCALPLTPPDGPPARLDARFAAPPLPPGASILAADGSQIAPDRHAEVNYCLINVGAIQMQIGAPATPVVTINSRLLYDDELYTDTGQLTDAQLALQRDLNERRRLAELAQNAAAPVLTFTDGPMELWGASEGDPDQQFQKSLREYVQVLEQLSDLQAATAGYVDKPGSILVVRLLEVALLAESELPDIRRQHPLRGVMDIDLFRHLLAPGERSAVFELQFKSRAAYPGELALHFFYLNVGRPGRPWPARVEVPAWVARSPEMLGNLHAVLVDQCRIMGSRPYPYLLHRAHEAAVVTLPEKDQVTQMIALELRGRQVEVSESSNKQASKDLPGRTRYSKGKGAKAR
jgi:hypothetical protein